MVSPSTLHVEHKLLENDVHESDREKEREDKEVICLVDVDAVLDAFNFIDSISAYLCQ
jgi:hypothetical protein